MCGMGGVLTPLRRTRGPRGPREYQSSRFIVPLFSNTQRSVPEYGYTRNIGQYLLPLLPARRHLCFFKKCKQNESHHVIAHRYIQVRGLLASETMSPQGSHQAIEHGQTRVATRASERVWLFGCVYGWSLMDKLIFWTS